MKNPIFLLLLLLPFTILSQGGFTITNYHVDVTLDDTGTALIEETIQLRFDEKRRGIIREIPTRGKFKGHTQSIKISDVQVENWKFTTKPGSNYEIKIGDKDTFISGNQEYKIKFTASNGILNFKDHEEFYWTLIGDDWNADIINATYSITLPKEVDLTKDDYQIFAGNSLSLIHI